MNKNKKDDKIEYAYNRMKTFYSGIITFDSIIKTLKEADANFNETDFRNRSPRRSKLDKEALLLSDFRELLESELNANKNANE